MTFRKRNRQNLTKMNIDIGMLDRLTVNALNRFIEHERDHILTDVSERNYCSRLGMYLEREVHGAGLTNYFADVEYNRKQGGMIKTVINGQHEILQITCDLIVHSRGEFVDGDNLIAIEMAKENKTESLRNSDRDRLKAMTKQRGTVWMAPDVPENLRAHPEHVCGYMLGVYIILDIANAIMTMETYAYGDRLNQDLLLRL